MGLLRLSVRSATSLAAIALAFGCGTRAPDARVASPPPPRPPPPPISNPPSAIDVPRSPLDDVVPACRGAALAFDTVESEDTCLIPNTDDHSLPPAPGPNVLEVTAAVAEKSVAPGSTATVVVTMTNKTAEPMPLYVDMTCGEELSFPIDVFDANKKRVDYISHENCDTNTFGCTRRVLRIAIEPGGSMRKTRSFAANVTRVAADCGDVLAGPMKRGRYVLHVDTGFRPRPDSPYKVRAETTLVVK